ncbi:MAG TPA: pyridoxamine 5'-phosphate oxidase family protein [Acidimicrobiia bacterium]|nr:pyridoxamine 5'-phosphate oxidase family protein [Acidimicrobiia bacterium]
MSLTMTPEERAAFLADPHIGVLSVAAADRGPLTVPVWYQYDPGGLVTFTTARASRKAELLRAAGRFSLCAQTETAPYQYVSVEGPVVAVDDPTDPAERRAMAHRYLGAELGDLYLEATAADAATSVTFRMRPEHWLAVDYGKQFG